MSDSPTYFLWLSLLPAAAFFAYFVRANVAALRSRPHIAQEEIVYQENFASGASQKNFLTKIGGARNCLRLVVTHELIWITAWFPFSVIAAAYDLFHVIPLRAISSIESSRFLGCDSLLLSYVDELGKSHTVRLMPRDQDLFLKAIQHPLTVPSKP